MANDGAQPEDYPVKSREALEWATIGGGRALMMEVKVGSLKPGKKADIVMLRATDSNWRETKPQTPDSRSSSSLILSENCSNSIGFMSS